MKRKNPSFFKRLRFLFSMDSNEVLLLERCRMLPKHDRVAVQQAAAVFSLRIRKPLPENQKPKHYRLPEGEA